MVDTRRIQQQNSHAYSQGALMYWMNRDMRLNHNWAFERCKELSKQHGVPIIVVYNLIPNFLGGGMRQWSIKIDHLKEIEKECIEKDIGFVCVTEPIEEVIESLITQYNVGYIVTDFSPLKIHRHTLDHVVSKISLPCEVVDAHNIVPCFFVSQKQEFGAYTLRPKIHKVLKDFLVPFPHTTITHRYSGKREKYDWDSLLSNSHIHQHPEPVADFTLSYASAQHKLSHFITHTLKHYEQDRNDPTKDGQSNLSPYLHYGVLSAQHVALSVRDADVVGKAKESFLEELIVRRELSDNFCYYNTQYDSFEGFPAWAQKTLNEARKDAREYVYTKKQFEHALTHDTLWNAAQIQMVKEGKMHGYMRMYWAKKILEWTETPEEALEIALYLNDTYELDGRDPNGYAGVAWSIGGVHDRAWFKRPVFGQVRYMNENGARKKFNVDEYIEKYIGQ